MKISGLSEAEYVALRGIVECMRAGTADVSDVPACFGSLVAEPHEWAATAGQSSMAMEERTFSNPSSTIAWHLMALVWMPGPLAAFSTFAASPDQYRATLRTAWTKLMTADRFDGPTGNVCDEQLADIACSKANEGSSCGSTNGGKTCQCVGRRGSRNLLFASTPSNMCICA